MSFAHCTCPQCECRVQYTDQCIDADTLAESDRTIAMGVVVYDCQLRVQQAKNVVCETIASWW